MQTARQHKKEATHKLDVKTFLNPIFLNNQLNIKTNIQQYKINSEYVKIAHLDLTIICHLVFENERKYIIVSWTTGTKIHL